MKPTEYEGSQIALYLYGSDYDDWGWTAYCVITNQAGAKTALDPTAVFATKELAGQAAFAAACAYVDEHRKHQGERSWRQSA